MLLYYIIFLSLYVYHIYVLYICIHNIIRKTYSTAYSYYKAAPRGRGRSLSRARGVSPERGGRSLSRQLLRLLLLLLLLFFFLLLVVLSLLLVPLRLVLLRLLLLLQATTKIIVISTTEIIGSISISIITTAATGVCKMNACSENTRYDSQPPFPKKSMLTK